MSAEVYEVIARAMRYWFLFLMALIVWRCYRRFRRDRRQSKKRLKLLPDAGYVGELVVTDGGGVLKEGDAFQVPREGTLGFLRTNDLCVPVDGVGNRHLWFMFDDDDGLMIEPYSKNKAEVDGEICEGRRRPLYMAHGSRLRVGEAELRLRLFAGFEATTRVPSGGFEDENGEGGEDGEAGGEAQGAYAAYGYPPLTYEQLYAYAQAHAQWQSMMYAGMQSRAAMLGSLTPEQYRQVQAWIAQNQAGGYAGAEDAYLAGEYDSYDKSGAGVGAEGVYAQAGAYSDAKGTYSADEYAAYNQLSVNAGAGAGTGAASSPLAREYAVDSETSPTASPAPLNRTVLTSDEGFFPPEGAEDDDVWDYAPYPCADAEDGDIPDAMQPPRSAYVGHDDAELAKKKVWDRYLGRGRGR